MRLRYTLIMWVFLGMAYMMVEGLWRGWTHISMLVVGGLCALCVGSINQIPRFTRLPVIWQSLLGTVIVLTIELISGYILNICLGLGIWDYSGVPGNILGQICPQYGLLWFCLMPFAIWAEDTLRWALYGWQLAMGRQSRQPELPAYSLGAIYRDLIRLR